MISDVHNQSDIRHLLKQFGIIIYTGDKEEDRMMMLDELTELYRYGMVEATIYKKARLLLQTNKPQP